MQVSPSLSLLCVPSTVLMCVVSFVFNEELYVTLPATCSELRSLARCEALHSSQCAARFHMSELHHFLFSRQPWPRLDLSVGYSGLLHTSRQRLTVTIPLPSTVTVSRVKCWWMECTVLWLLLQRLTRFLCRHYPQVDARGRRLEYRLPRLLALSFIDSWTSRYVTRVLRGGVDNSVWMFDADDWAEASSRMLEATYLSGSIEPALYCWPVPVGAWGWIQAAAQPARAFRRETAGSPTVSVCGDRGLLVPASVLPPIRGALVGVVD